MLCIIITINISNIIIEVSNNSLEKILNIFVRIEEVENLPLIKSENKSSIFISSKVLFVYSLAEFKKSVIPKDFFSLSIISSVEKEMFEQISIKKIIKIIILAIHLALLILPVLTLI